MAECPSCGEPMDEHSPECPSCSDSHSGKTEEFGPVVAEDAATAGGSLPKDGPVLVVRKGPQPGERFYLDGPSITVGRDPGSDIFLNDMTVSRAHAEFFLDGARVTVRDAGSLNGTYVNGVISESAALADGDVVQIGTFQMVFFNGKEA